MKETSDIYHQNSVLLTKIGNMREQYLCRTCQQPGKRNQTIILIPTKFINPVLSILMFSSGLYMKHYILGSSSLPVVVK